MSPLTMFGWWLRNVRRSCHGRFFDAEASRRARGSGHECPNFIGEFAWIGSLFAHQDADQGIEFKSISISQPGFKSRVSWETVTCPGDAVQKAAPKAKVLNRERVRFEVAAGNHRLVAAFGLLCFCGALRRHGRSVIVALPPISLATF
jgi:hypothetical protein